MMSRIRMDVCFSLGLKGARCMSMTCAVYRAGSKWAMGRFIISIRILIRILAAVSEE